MLPPIIDDISQSIGSTPMIRLTTQNKGIIAIIIVFILLLTLL